MSRIVEQDIEDAALDILQNDLGYNYVHGAEIAPDSDKPERARWDDVVLVERLKRAVEKINPGIPEEARERAVKMVLRLGSGSILRNNEIFHKMLSEGIDMEFRKEGRIQSDKVWLVDFLDVENNEFLAVNQFAIVEGEKHRRPDIVIFVNGMPLSLIELKNPGDEKATIDSAYGQIDTYKQEIPSIFNYNEILVISDGNLAQSGTISCPREWFLAWKTIDGKKTASPALPQLQVMLEGMFKKKVFLDLIKHFITFNKTRTRTDKVLAGYHQYHAANEAIDRTVEAMKKDGKIGVVWHTQGSGKSLTMAFYASKLAVQKELNNPTLVVLTDRNDLDDQLFNTFASCSILRETPIQLKNKDELKEELKKRASGGIIFTTIQKFDFDEKEILSERKNIIVAADEAHRSQYGFSARVNKKTNEIKYGLAKYLRDALPNACFIGFTGTPIDFKDKSTRTVFGDYIDIYDIHRAVEDERTVRIYYEPRLIKVSLSQKEIDKEIESLLNEEFPTEDEEAEYQRQKNKSKFARVESIVGADKRIKELAKDLVNHFEQRQEIMKGKAMVVCMSRRICINLYNEIMKLKPEWHNKEDKKGKVKVIMTGSAADGADWQQHIRSKDRRAEMGELFKDPESEFKLAIVRDMWLTGFDVPSLNTLYVDKPMKGHGLMQAIARVNRVYSGKQGGLIVDYLGLAHELKLATKDYTENKGEGNIIERQAEAIALMLDKYDIVKTFLHKLDYKKFFTGSAKEKMQIIPAAMDLILKQNDGKRRFMKEVAALSGAFGLAVPSKEAEEIRDEVALFQAIKASFVKNTLPSGKTNEQLETAIKQIVSKSVASKGVIDLFKDLKMDKPNLGVLSDEFLAEVENLEYKNLAIEALKKLLEDEIRVRFEFNKVKLKKFSEMLEEAIIKYRNRSLDSAQIVKALVDMAKKFRDEKSKGKELSLTKEEEAFYDALASNQSAVDLLGDKVLAKMAAELTRLVRENASIDWTMRQSIQAKLKVMVKRLLRKYGYPPDKQKMATDLVLEQAEGFAEVWAKQ
jgi:type I restriction enzyme R subunit